MTRILKLDETFGVSLPRRTATCSLRLGYNTRNDGIYWALQHSGVLADSYTNAEINERRRIQSETPVQNGDVVQIDGRNYAAKVLGNYSDAVVFVPTQRCPNCGDTLRLL
jgi:hypothetical protein